MNSLDSKKLTEGDSEEKGFHFPVVKSAKDIDYIKEGRAFLHDGVEILFEKKGCYIITIRMHKMHKHDEYGRRKVRFQYYFRNGQLIPGPSAYSYKELLKSLLNH